MKRLVVLMCFCFIGYNLYSESAYIYNVKKDIVISGLSLGLIGGSCLAPGAFYGRPDDPLRIQDVNILDRGLMFPKNETWYAVRDIVRVVLPVLPIITPLSVWGLGGWTFEKKDFDLWLTYGIMYIEALALVYGTDQILKKTIDRYRPSAYFGTNTGGLLDNSCFPSDTTAVSFLASTFLSVTFSEEHPDSPWKLPVIIGSQAFAASIGALGILSGQHFLTDVLAAAALGSLYGWLVPTLHRRPALDDSISFRFTGNGAALSLKW